MSIRSSHELTIDELRELLGLPNQHIVIIYADGTFKKVNEEIQGRYVRDYVHPEDWEKLNIQISDLIEGRESVFKDKRSRIRRSDGSWRWISWTGKATAGKIYASGIDITRKIEYEEALTVQTLVLESISEGVIICNDKGVIVFANSAAEKLYGFDQEGLLGQTIYQLSGNKFHDVLNELEKSQVWKGEFENSRMDGTHFMSSCRVTPLDLHGKRHFVCVQRDISIDKKLTRDIVSIETRFKTFFEQSPLGMIIFDLEGRPLEINHAWEKIFDVSREAFKDFQLMKDPFAISMGHIPYIERALNGEVVMIPPFYIEPQLTGTVPGARPRWLEVWFSPIKGPDNSTRELACILKDITVEVETQKSLQELESKYRIASESLSLAVKVGKVGIWEWLPRENRIIWDETTEEIFGYHKGTSLDDTEVVISHFHQDDRERCMNVISESLKNGTPYAFDYRIRRKDGVIRWLRGAGMPFHNPQGEVWRVLGTAFDITEHKEQEEDQKFISDISEILSSSFDYVKNIQKVLDLTVEKYFDGAIVDEFNRLEAKRICASARSPEDVSILFKLHQSNIVKMPPEWLNTLTLQKEYIIDDLEAFLKEGNFGDDYIKMAQSLKLKQSIVISLMGKHGPVGVVAFHYRYDSNEVMTERTKRLAREIGFRISLALENSLLFHQSLEAIRVRDEFLSIASHELKTPLQSLTLQNDMRRRMIEKGSSNVMDPAGYARALDMDKKQFNRINRLIDDMLDISRIKNAKLSLEKENFNLISLIDDITERLEYQFAAAGCILRKEYSGEVAVFADSYRIEQVLVNILTNAMKYGSGSPVVLSVKVAEDKVIVEITDKGQGILESDCERIFHRFERAVPSKEVSGLGLGLYIAREIMALHDGKVYVQSAIGKGSTFIMELPL